MSPRAGSGAAAPRRGSDEDVGAGAGTPGARARRSPRGTRRAGAMGASIVTEARPASSDRCDDAAGRAGDELRFIISPAGHPPGLRPQPARCRRRELPSPRHCAVLEPLPAPPDRRAGADLSPSFNSSARGGASPELIRGRCSSKNLLLVEHSRGRCSSKNLQSCAKLVEELRPTLSSLAEHQPEPLLSRCFIRVACLSMKPLRRCCCRAY